MTAQAGPHAQFQRGICTRSVFLAETAARELGRALSLSEALSLPLLYRDDPDRYDRAAARWIGRYIGNGEGVTQPAARKFAPHPSARKVFSPAG